MQELMGIVDPNEIMANGMTWGEYMTMMMDEAEAAATAGLDVIEDRVHDAYDTLVERLTAASDALLNFATAANTAATGDPEGYTDPVTGEWIPRSPSAADGSEKTLTINQPITVNVQAYIDGQQLRASIDAQVQNSLDSMRDWIIDLRQQPPVID